MREKLPEGFRIKTVNKSDGDPCYEGLRRLWSDVFGDPVEFVDAVYDNFGADINGYAVLDADDEVVSSLTCYKCGTFEGKPVHVSYAVCTREDCRGLGLAGTLTRCVKDEVISQGGISLISPAEESLQTFYADLGYEPFFCASRRAVLSPEFDIEEYDEYDEEDNEILAEAGTPELDMTPVSAEVYNRYREAFLSGRPHVEMTSEMLALVRSASNNADGLYAINRGDAICVVEEASGRVVMSEFIVSPILQDISEEIGCEIASMIAGKFGAIEAEYHEPGGHTCQAMAAGIDTREHLADDEEEYIYREAYFGFPLE